MRLFLCDDNADYRRLARMAFERAGHEIVGEADNGRHALDAAPNAGADVILLDLNMPVLNGFEALPHLRSSLPTTKIVVLTTGCSADERRRALDAGADAFIVKPDRVFALGDELSAALAS